MKTIAPQDLQARCREGGLLLDVRRPDEFELSRIAGAQLLPLDEIESRLTEIPRGRPVYVYCRSGNRSRQAVERLRALGFENLVDVEGGLQAYQKCGGPVLRLRRGLPIMQQVQVVAGGLALAGSLAAWFFHPAFLFLTGFVGAGLIFAGSTGYCGMAQVLSRMPWNRTRPSHPPREDAP